MNLSLPRSVVLLVVIATFAHAQAALAQQPQLADAHRWYLLANEADRNDAPLMARTYYTMALTNHPHYLRIRTLSQRAPMNLTTEDTSFALYCNALAWIMITHPIPDDENYEAAKALAIVGAQIGGVNCYSADTIATVFALSNEYAEAYKWAMTSAALHQLRENRSDATLRTVKEKIANIVEMIQDEEKNVVWDERSLRKYLQLPELANNRYSAGFFDNSGTPDKTDMGFILSANPLTQTAWIRTVDGDLIRLRKAQVDDQVQYANCAKAFLDWSPSAAVVYPSLRSHHEEFVRDTGNLRAMMRTGFRNSPELRPASIREVNDISGSGWKIKDELSVKAAASVQQSSAKWSKDLALLVEGTRTSLSDR